MSPRRIASLTIPLFAIAALDCDPGDQPAPVSPQNAMTQEPLPEGPPQSPQVVADTTAAGADTVYASGEVAIGTESEGYDDDDPAALTDFHAALDPHGTWVDDPTYGTVWAPSPTLVGPDFSPYVTAGHWVYDDDWVWVSDYDWGWAPFHYGRWVFIESRGWSWIPGRAYRGAWVMWGVDDGYTYVGWAPMGPAFIWFGGVARPFGGYVGPRFVYCPRNEVFSASVRMRMISGAAAAPIAARVRAYGPARPGVALPGPSPQKLGFQSAQIPHSAGASAIARAEQFSRPSTAQSLGAHGPTRVWPISQAAASPRNALPNAGIPVQASGRGAATVAPAPSRSGGRGSVLRAGVGSGHAGGGHHR